MRHRTFFWFILPSLAAMLLFIALPIVSVAIQSLYVEHEKVLVETENCQPFGGCTTETKVDTAATEKLNQEQPLGKFNGLGTYLNRAHLAVAEIETIPIQQIEAAYARMLKSDIKYRFVIDTASLAA